MPSRSEKLKFVRIWLDTTKDFKYLKINSQYLRSVILITNKKELFLAKKWEKRCDLPVMETLRENVPLCRKNIILSETATYARDSR